MQTECVIDKCRIVFEQDLLISILTDCILYDQEETIDCLYVWYKYLYVHGTIIRLISALNNLCLSKYSSLCNTRSEIVTSFINFGGISVILYNTVIITKIEQHNYVFA